MTSVRCHRCLYSFHGETIAVRDRYLAHIPVCPVIAALPAPTVAAQAASFLAHPSHGERVEAGDTAASGAPTGDGGGAGLSVVPPDAAPTDRRVQAIVNWATQAIRLDRWL